MTGGKYIYPLDRFHLPLSAGSKALNLRRLMKLGMRTPVTYICDWEAHHRHLEGDENLAAVLKDELKRFIKAEKNYAVRSSANLEDSLEQSFAGQFKTILFVQGVDDILQAIYSVWSSAQTPIVHAYLKQHNIADSKLSMAVLIQEMVRPVDRKSTRLNSSHDV